MQNHPRNLQPVDHSWYKSLSSSQRHHIISTSKQQQIYRAPKPMDNLFFTEQNFITLTVLQTESKFWTTTQTEINLATYREKSSLEIVKGVVILFHGLTSHTNEGVYVAKELAKVGYTVVGYDQRGFGKSGGRRGYIPSLQTNINDAVEFVVRVRELYPETPLIICGLSMGGLLCFNLALKYPTWFSSVILMAPALRSHYGLSALYATKFLSFFSPYMQVPKRTGGKHGSKNPNVSQSRKGDTSRYRQDPYINTLKCVLDGMKQSQEQFGNLNCKRLLLIQGAVDNSVDPSAVIELYERAKCEEKEILFYKNMWHSIWQEEEIYDIMPRMIRWLNKESVRNVERKEEGKGEGEMERKEGEK